MRALLLLASATSPLMAFCVWSGLPGHADNNVFNLAELPPLPVETSQLPTPQPLNDRSLPTDDTHASDSLWFQLTRTISLSRLAEALDLAPDQLAELNGRETTHLFAAKSWAVVPESLGEKAESIIGLDKKSRRDSAPLTTPPPVLEVASVQKGDSLASFLARNGVSSAELKTFNPGLQLNALTVGRELRVAQASPGQSMLAIRPTVSGGAAWPIRPSFNPGLTPAQRMNFGRHYRWPTKGVFTSGFGWRWGRMHKGIDIANNTGTPILASRDGVVAFAGWSGAYGYLVEISHADGDSTRYAHNSRLLVKKGQIVPQGSRISLMGSTGRSTGPHLHFEIRRAGGAALNPLIKLPARKA
ncbi:peptidoglycan DD-metalloendopeptidase family protein [bacterium]|nr:peptidoglycan DD-metalloendopeptidase family protein [bacterium]